MYKKIFEKSIDGVFIIEDNKFVDCNNSAVKMFQYESREQLLNTHTSVISPEYQPDGKTSFEKAEEHIKYAYKNGNHCFEWVHLHLNGESLWTEVVLTDISTDDKKRLLAIVKDISEKKQLEKQNNCQHVILNAVLNSTPDLIFYKDYLNNNGRYIGCNEAFEKFVGKSNQDIIGKTDIELFGQEVGNLFRTKDKKVLDRNETVINEEWVDYPNGDKVLMSTSKSPFKDKNNNIIGVLGIARDITHVHEKTKEIKNLKEQMELALLGNKDGIWDWNLLTNSVYLSPLWKKMLGYSDDELLNEFSTWKNRVHPEDIESVMKGIKKNIKGKTDYYEGVHRLRHKNGSWVWILARGKAIFNEDGKAIRMTGTHTDITKQKEIEEKNKKLLYSVQNFQELFDSTIEAIVMSDKKHKIIDINLAGVQLLKAKTKQEIIGRNMLSLLPKEEEAKVIEGFKQTVNKPYKLIIKSLDGKIIYTLATGRDTTIQGKFTRISTIIDITEVQQKDEQLLQQSKLAQMGEMMGMIAHQWRQPLNAISASSINLSLMSSMNILKDEKVQESSEFIQNQTQKMSSTIDTFMNFVKPAKESKPFKFLHTVEAIMKIMGAQLINHNIKVNIESKNDNISIVGYEDLLEQVIINLLSNSRDAFEEIELEEKYINITIDMKNDIPIIIIEDNAGGIPHAISDKIFNPYFTTKEQGKGTGIGLYMSKDIMEKSFGGNLIYSAIEGGSRFEIICGMKKEG